MNKNHLYWATKSQNQMDRVAHGTSNQGSKLTDEKVREILADLRPASQIARSYMVDYAMIYRIKKGKVWKHITNPEAGKRDDTQTT